MASLTKVTESRRARKRTKKVAKRRKKVQKADLKLQRESEKGRLIRVR